MFTLDQLKFLDRMMSTQGLAMMRPEWKVASETDAALKKAIAEAEKSAGEKKS